MGALAQLEITTFRNIKSARLDLSPGLTLLYGDNGSGKTSVLEAIFLLSTGRSFRTSRVDSLVQHGCNEAIITADLADGMHIGFRKPRMGSHELRIDQEKQAGWERVARHLPVQVLDAGAFSLVEGGPKERRRFLDWGVFHVEQGFIASWRRASKAIAQRNRLLKSGHRDESQLRAWDDELVQYAIEVDRARSAYFREFKPQFDAVVTKIAEDVSESLDASYYRGWPEDADLRQTLLENREQDYRYGATQFGPHRADLVLEVAERKAAEVLSRGQQKLVVSALKIAQGSHFGRQSEQNCTYLLDDLPAELDPENRARVIRELLRQGSQLILTSVEREALIGSIPKATEIATFHVERGKITA